MSADHDCLPRGDQIQRHVDDHVLLAADHPAPAELDQDRRGCPARTAARLARRAAGSWSRPRRSRGSASPGRPAPAGPAAAGPGPRPRPCSANRSQPCSQPSRSATAMNDSIGQLPGARALPGQRGVDRGRSPCSDRDTSWRRRATGCGGRGCRSRSPARAPAGTRRPAPRRRACQPAAGVGDVDALRAVRLHQLGLRGQRLRRRSGGASSGSRRRPCRARGPRRCAGRRCRPRCSGWRRGRSVTPSAWARLRSSIVPMPGSSSVVSFAPRHRLGGRLDPLGVGLARRSRS